MFAPPGLAALRACLIVAFRFGALAQASLDPDAMASAPAPKHDPAATHDGRSASDYAEFLAECTSAQRRTALQPLAGLGVDALPAPEVRFAGRSVGLDVAPTEQMDLAVAPRRSHCRGRAVMRAVWGGQTHPDTRAI